MNGIFLINKEKGSISRDVVNKIVKKLGIKKVGHTGTLDPIATGVLVICVGKATKVVDLLTSLEKEYIAEVMLGIKTDTLDITGNIVSDQIVDINVNDVGRVLKSFIGKYSQEVPIYSAVKIKGKKLYEYARNNEEVLLPKREVNIKNIELISDIYYVNNHPCFKFKCTVSKGTYIRSLIKDICEKLNVNGTMLNLTRTRQGQFYLEDCILVDDVDKEKLIKIQDILNIEKVFVDEFLFNKIRNGQILENRYKSDLVMFIYNDKLLAIYKIYDRDNSKMKPYKMFGGI